MASNAIGAAKTPDQPEPEDLNTSEFRRVVTAAPPPRRSNWRAKYARLLTLSDLIVLVAVVYGTQLFWFGIGGARVSIREDPRLSVVSYWLFSTGLVALWMWSLSLIDSRTDRVFGAGSTEYIRIISVSTRLFGIIAIAAFLLRVDVARGYLLISLPLGVAVLLLERRIWRQWLIGRRRRGEFSARVLLVGSERSVAQIGQALQRVPSAGYHVVGACIPGGPDEAGDEVDDLGIPVLGDVTAVAAVLRAASADTVAITSTDDLPPSSVKRISWDLEAGRQHLVLAPSIVDVVGPRIQTRPVAGLPLIHVETPRYSKGQRIVKRSTDVVVSALGIILLSPLLLVLGLAIRATSHGPALFRQTRVGLDGREFRMFKFRTMVHNAEELLGELRTLQDAGNEVLFKMSHDPRTTRLGRFLRRYSLDELPQLFNVLAGSMSLVGPRPPLPREVRQYADHVHRRFMVKPGITGLWQVSGRSTLSWEESVRLDLSYVENWTLVGDLVILFKTARATIRPGGTAA